MTVLVISVSPRNAFIEAVGQRVFKRLRHFWFGPKKHGQKVITTFLRILLMRLVQYSLRLKITSTDLIIYVALSIKVTFVLLNH